MQVSFVCLDCYHAVYPSREKTGIPLTHFLFVFTHSLSVICGLFLPLHIRLPCPSSPFVRLSTFSDDRDDMVSFVKSNHKTIDMKTKPLVRIVGNKADEKSKQGKESEERKEEMEMKEEREEKVRANMLTGVMKAAEVSARNFGLPLHFQRAFQSTSLIFHLA